MRVSFSIRTRYTILFLVGMMFLAFILTLGYSSSAIGKGIRIEPLIINLKLSPGEKVKKTVKISNNSEQTTNVELAKHYFEMAKDGSLEMKTQSTSDESLTNWFSLPTSSVKLNPKESQKINIIFKRPSNNTSNRPYWGCITAQINNTLESGKGQYKIQAKTTFVIAILQRNISNIEEKGGIEKVKANFINAEKSEKNQPRVVTSAKFSNKSPKILKARVHFEIRDFKGNVVVSKDKKGEFVFPNSFRTFKAVFPVQGWKEGEYIAIIFIDYGGRRKVGGQYKFKIPKPKNNGKPKK